MPPERGRQPDLVSEPVPDGTPAAFFDQLYARNLDPWAFETSAYERAKYTATLAELPPQIGRGFEIGCSIGVLTQQLAARCTSLLAVDVATAALARAQERCASLMHVEIRKMTVPQEWPAGTFDMILWSEVLYFLGSESIRAAARRTREALAPGGVVVLVNWFGSTGTSLTGDAAATLFIAEAGLASDLGRRTAAYRLDRLCHAGAAGAGTQPS